jgi:hypothetical protein
MQPVKADELVFLGFKHLRAVRGTIPGKTEHTVPLIYFFGKPFLETGRGGKEFKEYIGRTPYRIFQCI